MCNACRDRAAKETVMTFLKILAVIVLAAFLIFAFAQHGQHVIDHNEIQIRECKALGGFARTNTDGYLLECTFPRGVR